ncbi:MAG: decaprenyl-phosphate phosphoribosyltransferase [Candidatus Zixiibacteriota bacterium]
MWRDLIKVVRPQQWLKNSVVLAAIVFAGELGDSAKLEHALLATGLFCLLSSAMYVFNDIIDRAKDRRHPLKKDRPLASGRLAVAPAAALGFALIVIGLGGSSWLGGGFFAASAAFLALNVAYSMLLKDVVILDAMTVAISFVLRAYAGAIAIDVAASKWLLINTLLLALFLSFGKRRHELVLLDSDATAHRRILGKYSPYLLDQCIGVTTASVVVMYMLYSFSSEVMDKLGTHNLFLTIPFVVYGVFRYLYLIHKEEKGGSPMRVLITDRPILITVTLWILTVMAVLYWV